MEYDTIVIGLGSAGTTAASELARAGRKVLALEAQDRIGGRVYTYPFGNGVVELGAEWIHGTNNSRVFDTGIKNNIDLVSHKIDFELFRSNGANTSNSDVTNELVGYCFSVTENPQKPEPLGDFITRRLLSYIEQNYPDLLKDKDYIDEFLNLVHLFINNNEASDDWNDVNTSTKYTELEGDQHMSWHKHGYKTFFELMLNKYKNGPGYPTLEIKLNTEVTNIKWPQGTEGHVVVTTKSGDQFTAKNVIVTVSIGVLKATHKTLFTPSLPQEKVTAISTIPIGVMDKIQMSFEESWWHGPGIFGFLWIGEERKAVSKEDYWTTRIFGTSSPKGADNVLTLWTSGEVAKLVETLPEDVVKRKCMELLRRFLGKSYNITEPTGIVRSMWNSNPFTRGSYSYDDHAVVANPSVRECLREPLKDAAGQPRVLFAGEATEDIHFSTVHGASDSGYREAVRLLPMSKL